MIERLALIVAELRHEPGLTSRELADRLDFASRHMSLVLLHLEEQGRVVHEGRRWFPAVHA